MNVFIRICAPLAAFTAAAIPFAAAQNPPPPPKMSARDVREEQRHIGDFLTYAASDLQKGLERAGGNNLDLATVSGLHAVDQLLQCSKLMDKDPQHVEQIHSLFDNDVTRGELRDNFFKSLKPKYDDLEDRLDNFAHSLKDRGYSAVLVAINKLRAWNGTTDDTAKQQIEKDIDKVVTEVSTDAANGQSDDAHTGLRAEGPGSAAGPRDNGDGTSTLPTGEIVTTGSGRPLGNGMTAFSSKDGIVLTDGSGHSARLSGATLNPDGTAVLADGRTVDLKNATIDPQGNVHLADGETLGPTAAAVAPNDSSRFVGADGSEVTIPPDFDWKNGVATGTEKVYVGGRGMRLIRETKVTFTPKPSPGQQNTFVVSRDNGESRSWAFDVGQVPGSEKKSSGSMTVTLELTDRNGATAFSVDKWDVEGPGGSPTTGDSSGAQTTVTFTVSGDYTVQVSGKTDWGSVFVIKKTLPVGVE